MSMSDGDFEHIETEWIELPDGVKLAARIWLPSDARSKPAPTVLEFLPYRRRDITAARDESTYPYFAQKGVAGVRVDMRGTGDSDGFFDDEYSETELSDAETVIAWIAAQPWCNGAVGMMGISWGGFNALQLAYRRPPALKAVISIASTVDRFADDIHYKGGAHLSAQLYWSNTMFAKIARPSDEAVVGAKWREQWLERLARLEPEALIWMAHQRRDDYWRHGSICEDYSRLEAPALLYAGWADGYRSTPWKALLGLDARSKAATGPWVHKYPHFAYPHPRADFLGEAVAWWRRWLLDQPNETDQWPAHRLFVEEGVRPDVLRDRVDGRWVALDDPKAPAPSLDLHLTTAGGLEASPGMDGERLIKTPPDCGADSGEYFSGDVTSDLPGDQRQDDGLSVCFETPPLVEAVETIGMPALRLKVKLNAPQGNLVARLVDVRPDGAARRVAYGVLNLSHRSGAAEPTPMTPGVEAEIEIQLDATAYRFKPGHRIRIALSTNYFPLILPAPTPVEAVIRTGADAVLSLPQPSVSDIEVAVPESETLPAYPTSAPGSASRRVRRDLVEGVTSVEMETDTGETTHPEHGMTWRESCRSVWSIQRDDPLSMEGRETLTNMRRRNGVETTATATHRLTATASHWVFEASLTCRENGAVIFERDWRREIPRDCI